MRGYKNFESDPHPGDLRHLVEIGYTENTINENGYPEPNDVVVCRTWASVVDAGDVYKRQEVYRKLMQAEAEMDAGRAIDGEAAFAALKARYR